MLETKAGTPRLVEGAPVGERRFQQRVGPGDIGRNEGGGAVDRTVDMAFGRQVQYRFRLHLAEYRVERGAIADIDLEVSVAVAGPGLGQGVWGCPGFC